MELKIKKNLNYSIFDKDIIVVNTSYFTANEDTFYHICVIEGKFCYISLDCYESIIENFAADGSEYFGYIVKALCLLSLTMNTPGKDISIKDAIDIINNFIPSDLDIIPIYSNLMNICDLRKPEKHIKYL